MDTERDLVSDLALLPFTSTSALGDTTEPQAQQQEDRSTSPLEREAMPMNDQRPHFSASELAGLPGMPTTARRVLERAKREAWPARPRTARGGGSEYPISCLPALTQAALADKVLSAAPASSALSFSADAGASFSSSRGTREAEGMRTSASGSIPDPRSEHLAALFDSRPESIKAEARSRLTVVQEYFALLDHQVAREAALEVVTKKHAISEATLGRYLALVKGRPASEWLHELAPAYAGRVATAEMSADAWEALKADYLRPERPSARACIARLQRIAGARGWTLPSTRTLLRRLEKLPRSVVVMKREGMKAARALFPAQQRDKAALAALQVINGDGYKHNLWVRFPDGEIVRAKTWFWQDVYSSKLLAWRTDKTEHTDVIRLSFGDLVEAYGIPGAVVIDNTLAAANKTMSGGVRHRFRFKVRDDEPDGVFKLLGVSVHWATPGHGQAKPVERAFGVGGIGEYIDKAPEFTGAWTGASTLDKPEYDGRTKAVELADLERVIAREVAAFNAMAERRGAVHQGRSFDDVFNESYARTEIRKAAEAQRRLWLLATEPVTAGAKDGAITLDAGRVAGERLANRYWSRELIDHAGRKLVARFDPKRLHEGVHVYTLDGRWICYAECDRPAGFMDAGAARERARARSQVMRSIKTQAVALSRMTALDAAKTLTLPEHGGVADSTIPAPKVVRGTFTEPLARPGYVPPERTESERAELAHLEAEINSAPQVNVLALRSDADKHAHWTALDARRGAGEQLADADEQFWSHWQTQDYYRDAVAMEADFEREVASRQANAA